MRSCSVPPPETGSESTISGSRPSWVRKAARPSGRWYGPEKRSKTRRERRATAGAVATDDAVVGLGYGLRDRAVRFGAGGLGDGSAEEGDAGRLSAVVRVIREQRTGDLTSLIANGAPRKEKLIKVHIRRGHELT